MAVRNKRERKSPWKKARFQKARSCLVCGGRRLEGFKKGNISLEDISPESIKITDKDYGKTWDLVRCRNCGHIFANPFPRPEYITFLYSRVEDPDYEEEAAGRSQNFLPILSILGKLQPGKGKLLDVGAATGILLALARDQGWEPDGVEPSSWAVRTAARKYGLRIRRGSIENVLLKKNFYDAVTMVDIVEHTSHPLPVVARAWDVLKPGGYLCLVTPDIGSFAARLAGRRWWHFRPGHLSYFCLKSLVVLLVRSGFSIEKIRRYAWTFRALYIALRLPVLGRLASSPVFASFLKRIRIKLALGDSFEIYARKEQTS